MSVANLGIFWGGGGGGLNIFFRGRNSHQGNDLGYNGTEIYPPPPPSQESPLETPKSQQRVSAERSFFGKVCESFGGGGGHFGAKFLAKFGAKFLAKFSGFLCWEIRSKKKPEGPKIKKI